jgi:hypothetical protein
VDDLERAIRETRARLEDVLMRCDETDLWQELTVIVDRREEDRECVGGEFILETWKSLVISRGLADG